MILVPHHLLCKVPIMAMILANLFLLVNLLLVHLLLLVLVMKLFFLVNPLLVEFLFESVSRRAIHGRSSRKRERV